MRGNRTLPANFVGYLVVIVLLLWTVDFAVAQTPNMSPDKSAADKPLPQATGSVSAKTETASPESDSAKATTDPVRSDAVLMNAAEDTKAAPVPLPAPQVPPQ